MRHFIFVGPAYNLSLHGLIVVVWTFITFLGNTFKQGQTLYVICHCQIMYDIEVNTNKMELRLPADKKLRHWQIPWLTDAR